MGDHVEPKLSPEEMITHAKADLDCAFHDADIDVDFECACGEAVNLYVGVASGWDDWDAMVKITDEGWTFRQDQIHGPGEGWWVTWRCPSCSDPNWTWPDGQDPNEEEGGEE